VCNSKAIIKYALIHVAELVAVVCALFLARHFLGIAMWLFVTILVLWILKDAVLFPRVWRAYAVYDNKPTSKLVDLEATVVDSLDPVGYVRVVGELWRAEIKDPSHPAARGEKTRVIGVRGMTLIVERQE